jgi:hypothetical protein
VPGGGRPATCAAPLVLALRSMGCAADIVRKVEHYLGGPLDLPPEIHVVRDVAPNKIMLCVSFRVPQAVAFAGRLEGGEARPAAAGGLPNKKARTGADTE